MLRDGMSESVANYEWCGVRGETANETSSEAAPTEAAPSEAANEKTLSHGERCDRVHRTLLRIVKARGALDAQEAAALREAQALGLWRRYGYGSLLEYMEMEMGYSPRAAIERLRVAHAITELPQIAEKLEQGELSFSGARELTRVATPETEGEWLGATKDMNMREVEEAVSGRKRGQRPTDPADPSLRKKVLRFEVRPETFALMRQVQMALEKQKGERLDDDGVLEALCRAYLDERAEGSRDGAAYQIAVTVCETCKRGWQDGGGVTVEMSPPAVERAQCDATHIGSLAQAGTPRAKDTIPKALRRKVKRRDKGKCVVPGCRSAKNCDLHHLKARALGGQNTEENLVSLCEAHHLALHQGTLMIQRVDGRLVFERTGRSNFTRAERAVETASALKNLGYKRDAIHRAIEQTRTHVGTADLTLDQWIRIALQYATETN